MRRLLIAVNILTVLCLASVAVFGLGPASSPVGAKPVIGLPIAAQPKIAVFNMAHVMKEFAKAKYEVYLLNEERKKLSVDLTKSREKFGKLQQEIQMETRPAEKEELLEKQRELARVLEDTDRKINKQLNEKASGIIVELYDDIQAVVDKLAESRGYDIVLAYPDATNADEAKSPHIKELKLKPPAAQPFYVSKRIDLTEEIVKALNDKHPAPPVPGGAQVVPMFGK